MTEWKTIVISMSNYRKLLKLVNQKEVEEGRRVSFNEIITNLLEGENGPQAQD